MKTLSLSLLIALGALALPGRSDAQSVNTGALVNYKASFLATGNVQFGQITPGTDLEVALNNTTSRGFIGVEFNARSVVTYTSSGTLTQTQDANGTAVSSNAGTILPTYYCAVVDDNGVQAGPGTSTTYLTNTTNTSCFTGNTVTLDLVANKKTARWIVVGGRIPGSLSANQPAGTYSGSVTISIARSAT